MSVAPKYTSKTTRLLYPGENFYIQQYSRDEKLSLSNDGQMLFGAGRFLCQVHFSAGPRPKYERLIKHGGQTNNGPIEDLDQGVNRGRKGCGGGKVRSGVHSTGEKSCAISDFMILFMRHEMRQFPKGYENISYLRYFLEISTHIKYKV